MHPVNVRIAYKAAIGIRMKNVARTGSSECHRSNGVGPDRSSAKLLVPQIVGNLQYIASCGIIT